MSWIIAINYFIILLLVRKIKNNISKYLLFLYVSYWFLSLFVSSLNLVGLFKVEDSSYILLIIHLYTFIIGYLCAGQRNCYKSDEIIIDSPKLFKLNSIFFGGLLGVCYLFVIRVFVKQKEILDIYSMSEVRGDFVELVLDGGSYLFYNTIAAGMFYFCLSISLYWLFFDRKWPQILILFSYCLLFSWLGGGRSRSAVILFYIIGFFILKDFILSSINKYKSKYVFSTKLKLIIGSSFVFFILVMSFFSVIRRDASAGLETEYADEGVSFFSETLINYSVGPVTAFDKGLKMKKFKDERHYGLSTIGGFEKLLYVTFIRYIVPDYECAYNKVSHEIQNNRILIGNSSTWNYAYTSCFYYYCDYGVIGIVIMPFFLGFLFRMVIKMMERKVTIFIISMYLFISYCFFNSVFTCLLHKHVAVVFILLMLVLHHYSRKRSVKKLNVDYNIFRASD